MMLASWPENILPVLLGVLSCFTLRLNEDMRNQRDCFEVHPDVGQGTSYLPNDHHVICLAPLPTASAWKRASLTCPGRTCQRSGKVQVICSGLARSTPLFQSIATWEIFQHDMLFSQEMLAPSSVYGDYALLQALQK